MKKLLYCVAALAMLLLAGSCQKENLWPSRGGDTVTFTVAAPGQIETKAIADGLNVEDLYYALYQTGSNYEIADDATPLAKGLVTLENKEVTLESGDKEWQNVATIDLDLVKDQYFVILFWAQCSTTPSHYTLGTDNDLRKITINGTSFGANDESRAAFYAKYNFDTKEDKSHNVPLKRPFAQLNLGTTEESLTPVMSGASQGYSIEVLQSEVKVFGLSNVFDLVDEKPEGKVDLTFNLADTPYQQTKTQTKPEVLEVQEKEFHYVSMNYFFVPSAGDGLVELSYKIKTDKGDIENSIINVPVRQNFRTNIIGNLLTTETNFEIVVDEDFKKDIDLKHEADGLIQVNPDLNADPTSYTRMYEISNANGFMYAMNEIVDTLHSGESIELYLLQTIDMATQEYVSARVPSGASVLLATGAAPMTRSSSDPIVIKGLKTPIFAEVENGATVTFSGIIVEDFGGDGAAFVDVNNGKVLTTPDCSAQSTESTDVAFIGSGDEVVDIEEGTFSTIEELQAALRTNMTEITLDNPIVISKDMDVVLDLNGKTVTAVDSTSKNYSMIDNRGTLVVKNGTMKVSAVINSGWNRYSAVIANNPGGHLTVENVEIEHLGGTDMAYGIDNLTNGKGTSAITVIDGATVKSPYRAVRQFLNGVEAANELYVKAGSVLAGENKGIFFHDPSKNANSGKLVVEDGASVGSVYLFVTEGSTEWPVEVSIASSSVEEGGVTYKNVPAGYEVVEKAGVYSVVNSYTYADATYTINTAAGLVAVSNLELNAGEKIVLAADIDLAGMEFSGLNAFHPENNNTFDGQNHVVSNWTYEGGASDMGFIRNWVGPIKNVTIRNASLKTNGRSAVLAAKVYGNIDNCHIVDCSIEDSYWACGGIAGLYNSGSISGCSVDGCSVKSNGGTGGIVGVINESAGTREIVDCVVRNSTINNVGSYGESYSGAIVCGIINIENSTVNFKNCIIENNIKEGNYVGDLYYAAGDDITVNVE